MTIRCPGQGIQGRLRRKDDDIVRFSILRYGVTPPPRRIGTRLTCSNPRPQVRKFLPQSFHFLPMSLVSSRCYRLLPGLGLGRGNLIPEHRSLGDVLRMGDVHHPWRRRHDGDSNILVRGGTRFSQRVAPRHSLRRFP